jgi:hypothetical protein
MAFLLEVPGFSPKLAVLSCTFPTACGTEAVFAGSLGDSMDIICPVTIRMRDVKEQCITLGSAKRNPIRFNLPTLGTDPLLEEGPDPVKGTFAEPSGQDCLGLAIKDPSNEPCIILLPKVFPLADGYSIPSDTETTTTMITATTRTTAQALPLEEFTMWYEAMRYGITNLGNYSIQARNVLFARQRTDQQGANHTRYEPRHQVHNSSHLPDSQQPTIPVRYNKCPCNQD